MAKSKPKLTFEQALAQLEQIVRQIESGEIPLEESIDRYAEGTRLIKQCRAILAGAEKKIQLLVKSQDGGVTPGGQIQPDEEP